MEIETTGQVPLILEIFDRSDLCDVRPQSSWDDVCKRKKSCDPLTGGGCHGDSVGSGLSNDGDSERIEFRHPAVNDRETRRRAVDHGASLRGALARSAWLDYRTGSKRVNPSFTRLWLMRTWPKADADLWAGRAGGISMKDSSDKPVVVVNDLVALRQRSGVGFYVSELLSALEESDDVDVVPLSRTAAGKPLRLASRLVSPSAAPSGSPRWLARNLSVLKSAGIRCIDRYLATAAKLFRWPLFHETDHCPAAVEAPVVTTVHDLSVILHPEWHPAHRVKKYAEKFARGLERSSHILTPSEAIRDEVIATFGVPAEKVTATRLAPRTRFRPVEEAKCAEVRKRYGLPKRFVLFVGNIEPRKNVSSLLDAYAILSPELRSKHPLAIVGGWGWKSEEVRERLTQTPWSECVRRLGYVSEDDLVLLLNAAAVLAYPSLYEGFGLPPVEAMACGTPVITTHAGGLRDSVGDAAHLVEPHDASGLAAALTKVLTDEEYSDQLTWRGYLRAAQLSWQETARRTAAAYRKAA
jgi:alpha-1,3-rhamnosyl/mannosyltransferase